jgi:hypothetical protein
MVELNEPCFTANAVITIMALSQWFSNVVGAGISSVLKVKFLLYKYKRSEKFLIFGK